MARILFSLQTTHNAAGFVAFRLRGPVRSVSFVPAQHVADALARRRATGGAHEDALARLVAEELLRGSAVPPSETQLLSEMHVLKHERPLGEREAQRLSLPLSSALSLSLL